ncbi:MAG: hypothetical protein K1Y02_15360 [Candidatus Hydrogenedentes bacterium]|nr:hypothetical protein [Candidatus Hydrogenedentota bacterium]
MTATQPAPETPRARKWLRRAAKGACILFPVAVLLATGWPQTRLVESIAGRALGAAVDVEGLSLLPAVHIRSLSVAAESYAPVLQAEDIRLEYAASLSQPLTALAIYRVSLHLDGSNPAAANYAFLTRGAGEPSTETDVDTKFLPGSVNIEHIDVEVNAPQASMRLEGLQLDAHTKGSITPSIRLKGDRVAGYVESAEKERQSFSNGFVDVALDNGLPLSLKVQVRIPDVADVKGYATGGNMIVSNHVEVNLDECRINGARVGGLLALLSPVPLTFEQADLSGTKANASFGSAQFALLDSTVQAKAIGVRLGEPGTEWYEGDVALSGTYAKEQLDGEVKLNRGQRLKVMAEGNIGEGKAAATMIGWSRDDFRAAMPVTMRPLLEQVPGLQQVEGTLEASWELPRYTAELSIDPAFAPSAGEKNQLAVTASGSGFVDAAAGPLWDGSAKLRLGKAQCEVKGRVETVPGESQPGAAAPQGDESEFAAKGEVKLDSVNPSRILAAMGWPSLPGVNTESLKGTLTVDLRGEQATLGVDVSAAPMEVGSLLIPGDKPLEVKGTLAANTKTGTIGEGTINVRLTDNGTLTLSELSVTSQPTVVKAHAVGKFDFDYLAPDLGIAGLAGALEIDAPLRYAGDIVSAAVTLKGDGLAYGAIASPYGTPITVNGNVRYDVKRGSGTMDALRATWGEGTTLTSESVALNSLSPVAAESAIAVATDLRPLVDLSLLDSCDGNGNASGHVAYGADGARAGLDWDMSARSLVLAKALAALGGVSAKGSVRYDGKLNGDGKFLVANAAAGGGLLTDIDGAFVLEDGVVTAEGVKARLYEGAATITARVDLFGPEGRGKVNAEVTDLNLDTFTKEYKPPVVLLTGLAKGQAELEWSKAGVTDMRVELTSDKDFSLNRESVEQLLLSALTSEVPGLKLLNRRIRKKTIGDEPMRKFDSAAVSLRLEGQPGENQRLMGPVALKSEMLDFSIDLGVDLGAIAEGLQLSQEAQLEDIEKISTDPLQWNQ